MTNSPEQAKQAIDADSVALLREMLERDPQLDELGAMLDAQPELVTAKGGDGAHPLHFAQTVDAAKLLIERGAQLDARDEDHQSTPAQWRIGDAPQVVRFLLGQGATPDVFLAAALGDIELTRQLVQQQPACTTYRIGHNNGPFPGIGYQDRGGTILQWTLGFNQSPQEIALKRGHKTVYELLMQHTPARQKLLVACTLADRQLAETILAEQPTVMSELDAEDHALLAKSCWETNKNIDAVRLMLDIGFPVDAPEFNHGYKPLHNAAWCGDPDLVSLLIERGHGIDERDPDFQSTAFGWAIHSCLEAKRHPHGDFAGVVDVLLSHGLKFDESQYPFGHDEIDRVVERYLGQ